MITDYFDYQFMIFILVENPPQHIYTIKELSYLNFYLNLSFYYKKDISIILNHFQLMDLLIIGPNFFCSFNFTVLGHLD